jgi:RHS repeat-associated protein
LVSNSGQYLYDANANMTYDPSKKITISYNPLNLPSLVEFDNSDFIEYTYTATGTKLRKTVTSWKTTAGGTTDYAGQFLYQDNELSCIFTPVGRIVPMQYNDETFWKHEYNLKDHLGNTRIVFAAHPHGQPEVMQQTSYYPFGLTLQQQNFGGALNPPNKLLYNGKELQDDELAGVSLDWYDYGMRMYDPSIGRWHVPDPVAEWAYDWTPYRYAFNNPISYFDPNGLFETRKEAREYRKENNLTGRVRKGADGVYSIDNRKAGTSTWNDSEYGVVTGAMVVADLVSGKVSNLPFDITFKYDPLSSVERGAMDSDVPAIIMHRTVSSVGANLYSSWKAGTKVAGTHFLVGEDGTVYQTGNLNNHTIHLRSGSSKQMYKKYFKKILNSNTVGIEVIGNYNATTKTWDPLTPDQVTAVAHLVLELTFRYDLDMSNVLPHENVQRKTTGEGQVVLDAIKETIQENW